MEELHPGAVGPGQLDRRRGRLAVDPDLEPLGADSTGRGRRHDLEDHLARLHDLKSEIGGDDPYLRWGGRWGSALGPGELAHHSLSHIRGRRRDGARYRLRARRPSRPGAVWSSRDWSRQCRWSRPSTGGGGGPTSASRPSAIPFARGSVSLRLYPHNDLAAPGVVSELCTQAALATEGGFAGVMTSEHHGGFPGYLPNPLQTAGFILDRCPAGWAAACPLLLPLRPTALVAEEAAWLSARHPGRVGLGVAAGALPLDFEAMDIPAGTAVDVFRSELPRIVDMLQGRDLRRIAGRPGAAGVCHETRSGAERRGVPGCGTAGGPMRGRHPDGGDVGSPSRLARLTAEYDGAGGTGTKVLIRRAWLGDVRSDLVEAQRQVYDSYAGGGPGFGGDQTVVADDPSDLAERLDRVVRESGADALNLRVHLPGMAPPQVREQIVRLGAEVVPRPPGPSQPALVLTRARRRPTLIAGPPGRQGAVDMGQWSRAEIEGHSPSTSRRRPTPAGVGDWTAWADQFTEDAIYIEHHFGTFHGREAIHEWISACMADYPGRDMPEFPIEWYIIDEGRGWVVCQVWNRMRDPR